MENFTATLMQATAMEVQCDPPAAMKMMRDRIRAAAERDEMHCVVVTRFREDIRTPVVDYLRRAGFRVSIEEEHNRAFGDAPRSLRIGWA